MSEQKKFLTTSELNAGDVRFDNDGDNAVLKNANGTVMLWQLPKVKTMYMDEPSQYTPKWQAKIELAPESDKIKQLEALFEKSFDSAEYEQKSTITQNDLWRVRMPRLDLNATVFLNANKEKVAMTPEQLHTMEEIVPVVKCTAWKLHEKKMFGLSWELAMCQILSSKKKRKFEDDLELNPDDLRGDA